MEWNKKRPVVPVDQNGHWMHYPSTAFNWTTRGSTETEWREIEPFEATLRIDGMNTGRSAKYLTMVDQEGFAYPMFLSDLLDYLKNHDVVNGNFTSTWTATKRGQNYGIRSVD